MRETPIKICIQKIIKKKEIKIMTYNPFERGEYPVGVRTIELEGESDGDYTFTTEIWYPAAAEYLNLIETPIDRFKIADGLPEGAQEAVRDALPADGRRPLVMYWHGGYGHRRELAALCIFLASHGFIVASPDFPGDHITHMYSADPLIKKKPIDDSAAARPAQASTVIDRIVSGRNEFLTTIVNPEQIGSTGMSMGGFTTLALNSVDSRPKASVAVAPMCGVKSPLPQIQRLRHLLRVDDWKSNVSTFVLTGSADALVLVDDVRELYSRLPAPKRLAVLNLAGHLHWADNAEQFHEIMRLNYASGEFPDPEIDGPALAKAFRPFSELCPAEHGSATMQAICLAHFEKYLKGSAEAKAFLDNNLAETFALHGIDLEVSG